MKNLKLTDLNLVLVRRNHERALALMDFANLLNAMYSNLAKPHTHLLGDCVLAKMNMLRKGKRIRKILK